MERNEAKAMSQYKIVQERGFYYVYKWRWFPPMWGFVTLSSTVEGAEINLVRDQQKPKFIKKFSL